MDSVTQMALGAAVGEASMGHRVGWRAALWGAICGTLPDLDVLIPLGDAVRDFTYHRGASHSLFILTLVTPLLVKLILKVHADSREWWKGWSILVLLVFYTHVLLDCFTVYGTQILWPFDPTPVTWSTIFIIDPLYTAPLLLGVTAALVLFRHRPLGRRVNALGLVLSTLYLTWTVGAKAIVEEVARASLQAQSVAFEQLLTVPTPFNTLLWRALAMTPDGYVEGYYSLLDETAQISWSRYSSAAVLLENLEEHWPVQRLRWFTKGFYGVSQEDGNVVITDLRMGAEPNYVFRFKVAEIGNPRAVPVDSEQLPIVRDLGLLSWVWVRMWGEGSPAG